MTNRQIQWKAAAKKRHDYRVENNLCTECAEPITDGKKLCEKHRKTKSDRVKMARKDKSLCRTCLNKLTKEDKFRNCDSCLEKTKVYKKSKIDLWKKNGVCVQCGSERMPGSQLCLQHYMSYMCVKHAQGCKDWETLYKQLVKQNFKCFYTGVPLILGYNSDVDHLNSVYNEGEKAFDVNNLVWADSSVNRTKSRLNYHDFIEKCRGIDMEIFKKIIEIADDMKEEDKPLSIRKMGSPEIESGSQN